MPTEAVLVGAAVAGQTAQARRQLEDLIRTANRSAFDIGELAYQVKQSGDYAGHTTFAEYAKTLEIKPRKLQYLCRIAEVFRTVNIPRTEYEPLGLARCREITTLDPNSTWTNPQTGESTPMRDFIAEFVQQGAQLPLDSIRKHVRTLKGLVGDRDITWLNLPFLRSVVENILNPTIELTRRNIGSVGKDDEGVSKDASVSQCIETWAVEYRNDPANDPQRQSVYRNLGSGISDIPQSSEESVSNL